MSELEANLTDNQQWHLQLLLKYFNEVDVNEPFPILYGLAEYMDDSAGPELDDKEYAQVVQVYLAKVLEPK